MKYLITGGNKLSGQVQISGNKNSVFPCVAAALLTEEEVVLENISNLRDTDVLLKILKNLGVKVEKKNSEIVVKASKIQKDHLPLDLMIKLRGSIVLVGALLSRLKKVTFYHPGGDIIGQRSIETHLEGFRNLGASLKRKDLKYSLQLDNESLPAASSVVSHKAGQVLLSVHPRQRRGVLARNKNRNYEIFLQEASVTATENLILASVLGEGFVTVKNCAKEPHVVDLCKMLLSMGAKIKGVGTDILKIERVNKLNGTKFKIGCDYIELGTYAIAAAITGGKITIKGIDQIDLDPILIPLKRFGISFERGEDSLIANSDNLKSPHRLTTNIWPGFPTDLMSAAIVLATQSKGMILCHDWMYEGRMFFIDKLISMGAQINLADPHRSLVYGPTKLRGRSLESPDIRAGMALVLAALVAKGKSVINQAELIERGYEEITGKLKKLGAQIERVDSGIA